MSLSTLKYRIRYGWCRFWRRRFPPRYFVATYGDMGLEVEFFRDPDEYEAACEEAEQQHIDDNIDTWTHGDIVP
jgi:hypothetical protein